MSNIEMNLDDDNDRRGEPKIPERVWNEDTQIKWWVESDFWRWRDVNEMMIFE